MAGGESGAIVLTAAPATPASARGAGRGEILAPLAFETRPSRRQWIVTWALAALLVRSDSGVRASGFTWTAQL